MTRRLILLIVLLATTIGGAYYYCKEPVPPRLVPVSERFRLAPIVQEKDEFDEPYTTPPELLQKVAAQNLKFPFKSGDRVAWIGSSSTYIGVWCRTMEFLLRSRHPDLQLQFTRHSTGGGTFGMGAARMPDWLDRSKPNLVFLNYGCNDGVYGRALLEEFQDSMRKCVERARSSGARVVLMTHQSADIRRAGAAQFFRRKHFADEMLSMATTQGWPIVDVHHPLEELQANGQAIDIGYTINSDHIHLTDSAYVAWGFFLYEGLNPPDAVSSLEINARDGKILVTENCRVKVLTSGTELAFERTDDVLPILPPFPIPSDNAFRGNISALGSFGDLADPAQNSAQNIPPRQFTAMESHSRYMLKVSGLARGKYALECNGRRVGSATDEEFSAGVNLNTLYLDARTSAPWNEISQKLWDGKKLSEIENRTLTFKLKPE